MCARNTALHRLLYEEKSIKHRGLVLAIVWWGIDSDGREQIGAEISNLTQEVGSFRPFCVTKTVLYQRYGVI